MLFAVVVPFCVLLLSALCGYQLHLLQASYQLVFDKCTVNATISGERDPLLDTYLFAREVLLEAEAVLALPSAALHVERNESGLLVESVPLGGVLAALGIPLQRARATIYSRMNGSRVFEYMSSPPAFALLDPLSDADTHREPPLLSVDWAHGSIEVRHAAASLIWPFQDRAFTVCNVAHPSSRTFVSKSVALAPSDQHALLLTHALQRAQEGRVVQAFNFFALRVRQVSPSPVRASSLPELELLGLDLEAAGLGADEEVYVLELEMLNFLARAFPTQLQHVLNVQFFPMIVRKIREELLALQ
ncbi:hypothetical protein B484DRAFT_454654 [Ochromonadaceae sp. CCMP2298]|nr:hypothetical protein B484DRAFT_454654 [Ochromonadaceae sp. CCMP2298]|eukprot:CAMPEP_0173179624 /NCGR_PEP_ID=MMETSP1141-20130122/6236_1 /TAXON_ID=483371 /ORGANISM="non described non described, Strain CCMP2298" /LENGTH=302 /DNA_ID=CAMNT_0014102329 /DNA_START=278 /DNA_END=1186 /DNA_ORIENTATION=-